ncbi:hypothetical protein VA7868_02903 [Vibrio aerogenes CECT 7868]|uniref:Uncharacterized protein n=1 Tax=Vibrio aerogenes CECT 7868 TaxID=1216006 RepID=A0A1M5ZLZ4_9VIBR|nr:hypothetical protein [Vibrio aerogenes]SHI25148.1 hypothetical protein VA7868_02903 [Vibrio aerogenes CECT 7868]
MRNISIVERPQHRHCSASISDLTGQRFTDTQVFIIRGNKDSEKISYSYFEYIMHMR